MFTKKYLRPCSCSGTNLKAKVKCTNTKNEIQSEIIELQITGIQIYFSINSFVTEVVII